MIAFTKNLQFQKCQLFQDGRGDVNAFGQTLNDLLSHFMG